MASRSTRKLSSEAGSNTLAPCKKMRVISTPSQVARRAQPEGIQKLYAPRSAAESSESSDSSEQDDPKLVISEDKRLKNYAAEKKRRIDKELEEYKADKMTHAEKEFETYKAESMARIDKQLGEYEVEQRIEKYVSESMGRMDKKFEGFKAEFVEDMSKVVSESNQRFKEMLAEVEKTLKDIFKEKRDETWNPTEERLDKIFRDLVSCVFLMGVAGTPSGDIMSQIRESADRVNVNTYLAGDLMNDMVGFLHTN